MHETGGADETLDLLCGEELKIFQGKEGYRFSIDAILLANFVRLKKGERLLDIGTGCGIIPIYMTKKGFQNPMTGVELQPGLFRVALKNKAANGCGNVEFLLCDVREGLKEMTKNRFSVVVCNPPYTRRGSGRTSPDNSRHTARYESELDLALLLSLASSLLSSKGRFSLIYPSKRVGELLYHAKSHRLEPKRLRFIHPRDGEESNLFLAEFLKDGGTGTRVEKPLVIHKDRLYTDEVQSYYSLKR
jgi:tRNA1Val (adenine37-N6)-methyltransferase